MTEDHGLIEPMQEFGLQLHFRAIKPVNLKKIIRLEVGRVSINGIFSSHCFHMVSFNPLSANVIQPTLGKWNLRGTKINGSTY